MSRTSFLLLAVAFGLFAPHAQCRAQVGFGSQTGFINTGGRINVSPIVTNQRRYVRMGMSAGVSELVGFHTFTAVRNYPGYVPINPIGFGVGPGLNPGLYPPGLNPGLYVPRRGTNFSTGPKTPRPTAIRFAAQARKFDQNRDSRLNRDELEKLVSAAVVELKQTPAVYRKLKQGAQSNLQAGTPITEKAVTDAFLRKCLTFDRDQDGALSSHETEVMAVALMRFLHK